MLLTDSRWVTPMTSCHGPSEITLAQLALYYDGASNTTVIVETVRAAFLPHRYSCKSTFFIIGRGYCGHVNDFIDRLFQVSFAINPAMSVFP